MDDSGLETSVYKSDTDAVTTRGVRKDSISDSKLASVVCRIFDIRNALLQMSDFRHSIGRPSNIEYLTSEARFFGFRIFDIRSAVRLISNIRHPKHASSDVSDLCTLLETRNGSCHSWDGSPNNRKCTEKLG